MELLRDKLQEWLRRVDRYELLGLSPACGVRGGAQRPVTSQGPGARRRAGLGGGAGADRSPRLLHQLRAPGPVEKRV